MKLGWIFKGICFKYIFQLVLFCCYPKDPQGQNRLKVLFSRTVIFIEKVNLHQSFSHSGFEQSTPFEFLVRKVDFWVQALTRPDDECFNCAGSSMLESLKPAADVQTCTVHHECISLQPCEALKTTCADFKLSDGARSETRMCALSSFKSPEPPWWEEIRWRTNGGLWFIARPRLIRAGSKKKKKSSSSFSGVCPS